MVSRRRLVALFPCHYRASAPSAVAIQKESAEPVARANVRAGARPWLIVIVGLKMKRRSKILAASVIVLSMAATCFGVSYFDRTWKMKKAPNQSPEPMAVLRTAMAHL